MWKIEFERCSPWDDHLMSTCCSRDVFTRCVHEMCSRKVWNEMWWFSTQHPVTNSIQHSASEHHLSIQHSAFDHQFDSALSIWTPSFDSAPGIWTDISNQHSASNQRFVQQSSYLADDCIAWHRRLHCFHDCVISNSRLLQCYRKQALIEMLHTAWSCLCILVGVPCM